MVQGPGGQTEYYQRDRCNTAHSISIVRLQSTDGKQVELISTTSRIDDIQDSSELRRGNPVAHRIFGVAQTINSANYAYFLAQAKLADLNDSRAFDIFTKGLLKLHRGQGMELYWRDNLICPTEEEYVEMVSCKTGGLFYLAVQLMQLNSEVTVYAHVPPSFNQNTLIDATGTFRTSSISWESSSRFAMII